MDGGGGKKYKILPQFREKKRAAILLTQSTKLKMKKGKYVKIRLKFYQRFRNISKTCIKKGEAIPNVEQQLSEFMQDIQP